MSFIHDGSETVRDHCYLFTVRDHSVLFATWLYTLFCDYLHSSFLHAVGGTVDKTVDVPSGYPNPGLVLYLLPQAAVGHWRLQGSNVGRVWDRISCVAELLIHTGILSHVGRGGRVDHQAEQDDEERQQVESWKLKRRKNRNALHKGVYEE